MKIEEARGIAAQAWCHPKCSDKVMDPVLAEAVAEKIMETVEPYVDALIWCSASEDFQLEGQARKGYEKLVRPLITHRASTETDT